MKKYKLSGLGLMLALVIGLGVAGIGVNALHAAGTQGAFSPMANLVSAIAQKFNLNPTDVQAVFDAEKAKTQTERDANFKTQIAADVTAGKITQAQADLIIAKQQELENLKSTLISQTPAERQAALKTQMDSLKTWATQNNIPLQYLHFGFEGHMKGWGGMMGRGMHNDNDQDDL